MKNKVTALSILSVFAFAFTAVFTGCASSKTLKNYSPLAIISVTSNKSIPWTYDPYNEEDDGEMSVIGDFVNKVLAIKNPELSSAQDRINYAEESLHFIIPDITGCEILDKDSVVNSEAYEYTRKSYFNAFNAVACADGYKDIITINGKNARILIDELGVEGLLIFDFNFRKEIVQGTDAKGKIGAYVLITAKVISPSGSEAVIKTIEGRSMHTIVIEDNHYNKNELVELMPEAIDSGITQFALSMAQ